MVFTLDVGSGTQDFLLYVDSNLRNCPKAVLPSPTRILADKIRKCKRDVYLYGYTMGGGAITKAVKEHIAKGYKVFADERAALTFADDLEKVREMGVLIEKPNCEVEKIETRDVDVEFYENLLKSIGYEMPEIFAIAVQDHGYAPKESNRVFRFKMFKKLIERSANLGSFLFNYREIPSEFNRMRDAAKCILDRYEAEVYVVDTVFAAVAGCLADAELPAILVNFGNSHTTAVVVNKDQEIAAILEHHTSVLKRKGKEYVSNLLDKFLRGEVDNEYVLNDGGHGCYVREIVDVRDFVCTGPNTWLSPYREVSGDPMIVGNVGMLRLLAEKGILEYHA